MQDGALVPETREGDVERLYREHGARLWRAVFAFSGDREVASDAVSEAFLQVIHRGEDVHSPLAWVWRAAFRIAAGELKDRGRRRGVVPEEAYEIPEPAEEVVRALAALSPKQRAAVVLHHYAGYPVKEIASMIGSTAPAVRVHLSVGRKRLRELLGGNDG
jgi:RNA polymerase sigma factor (sigma-70 family)